MYVYDSNTCGKRFLRVRIVVERLSNDRVQRVGILVVTEVNDWDSNIDVRRAVHNIAFHGASVPSAIRLRMCHGLRKW